MPLYEFECEACKSRFERILQKFTDPNPDVCPTCGKGPIRKLPSSPAIQFKGSGFYITDYAKKSSPDPSGSSKSSSGEKSGSDSGSSSSGSSESKSSDSKSTETKSTDSAAKSSNKKD
jgi:putative FmdB family regulatory protein